MRKKILEKVAEYYHKTFEEPKEFIPGKTKIHYAGRIFDEKELVNLVDSSLDFWLTHGRYSQRFEQEFSKFIGVKHCALVNSGSSANLLAFMALTSDKLGKRKISRGDEVITVAAGFPTTATPIIQYGAIPVFLDIKLDTYNIDVSFLKKALSRKTKAVMLAHTLGNPFDLGSVRAFCDKFGLWLIEDNCDALGARYKGRYTGSFGDISTCSFFPAHHITTGEGGAVCTNNSKLFRVLISMRDWGKDCFCLPGRDDTCGRRFKQKCGTLPFGYDHKYIFSEFGYNLKATEMQAAIGCAQLEKLPFFIRKRKENFTALYMGLEEAKDVFILPEAAPGSEPSWFGFIMTVKARAGFNRNEIVRFLEDNLIQTRLLFGGNLIRQPCFDTMRKKNRGFRAIGNLRNTDRVMRDTFWIGVYPGITPRMIQVMADTINTFLQRKRHKK